MPQAPALPPDQMKAAGVQSPTNPVNFLMAAAEAHSRGDFQSAPVPSGIDLQSGKSSRKKHLKVVK
jgi:hypothetical protein